MIGQCHENVHVLYSTYLSKTFSFYVKLFIISLNCLFSLVSSSVILPRASFSFSAKNVNYSKYFNKHCDVRPTNERTAERTRSYIKSHCLSNIRCLLSFYSFSRATVSSQKTQTFLLTQEFRKIRFHFRLEVEELRFF